MFPRRRTKKDSRQVVPKSQVRNLVFQKKKTRVLQGRKRIERHTERRSRTVHNWHAAGGFQCPPPLCKAAQQQQNAFTATSRGQPTPPPKGGRSTPVRPSVVVLFAFVCKFILFCVSVPFGEREREDVDYCSLLCCRLFSRSLSFTILLWEYVENIPVFPFASFPYFINWWNVVSLSTSLVSAYLSRLGTLAALSRFICLNLAKK